MKYRGQIISDWDSVDMSDPKSRAQVVGALTHMVRAHEENPDISVALQHYGTTGDFPTSIIPLLDKYRLQTSFDQGWKRVFRERDFRASQRNGFELLDVEDGLSFEEVPVGEKAKLYKMSGSKVQVYFVRYAAGLQWDRGLIDDREYWTLEDNAFAFRNKAGAYKAQVHYDLIDAITSAQNLAWQAPFPSTLPNTNENYGAVRDIRTINQACVEIIVDLADKGLGVNSGTNFILLAPIQLRDRITRALGLLNVGISSGQRGVQYNVTPVYTTMLASTSVYYVCAPGIKAISGRRMDLTVYERFDEMTYSDIAVGWMRFGAAIGDVEQFQRCSTA